MYLYLDNYDSFILIKGIFYFLSYYINNILFDLITFNVLDVCRRGRMYRHNKFTHGHLVPN